VASFIVTYFFHRSTVTVPVPGFAREIAAVAPAVAAAAAAAAVAALPKYRGRPAVGSWKDDSSAFVFQ